MEETFVVAVWAFQSRVMILLLQILLHLVIPDHAHSMEDVSMKVHRHPKHPALVEYTLGGLDNWDAEYFIFNAHRGYSVLEQTMAFFPLLPAVMRLVGHTLLLPLTWVWPQRTVMLVSGTLVNFIAFLLAACALYHLAVELTRNNTFSRLVVLLFCLNPASVFMSVVYSEALFSLFTFYALLALAREKPWLSAISIALATATRSNGIVLCGFLAYHCLNSLWHDVLQSTALLPRRLHRLVGILVSTGLQCLIAVCPFVLFQCYGYFLYCKESNQPSEWCKWKIPVPYSYIQQHYWNVGFLRYFQLKQIPNFLLAAPMLVLSVYSTNLYFWTASGSWSKARRKEVEKRLKDSSSVATCYRSTVLRPYMFHLIFLALFGFFSMHVQVLTRFISSSSPVIYLAAGHCLWYSLPRPKAMHVLNVNNWSLRRVLRSLLQELWQCPKEKNVLFAEAVMGYFLSYIVLGCALHCNFYPWT